MIWEYEIHFLIYLYAAWACWFPAIAEDDKTPIQAAIVALFWPLWPILGAGHWMADRCRAAGDWINRLGQ